VDRRTFLEAWAGGLLAAPLAAEAQGAANRTGPWRLGVLGPGVPISEVAFHASPFAERLRELGYVVGRNL
jgi:hypothetical protein